jgi:hypothetical protein
LEAVGVVTDPRGPAGAGLISRNGFRRHDDAYWPETNIIEVPDEKGKPKIYLVTGEGLAAAGDDAITAWLILYQNRRTNLFFWKNHRAHPPMVIGGRSMRTRSGSPTTRSGLCLILTNRLVQLG